MLELYVVMIFMIIGALVAVGMRGLLSSVLAVGAVGMGLCVMFLLLRAPDLAITQLVVEILMLIVLIRATIGRGVARADRRSSVWIFAGFVFSASLLIVFAALAMREIPAVGQSVLGVSRYYIENALLHTGAANIVSAIILDFRAYDTLGEATVLFASVLGVLVLMREKGRKKVDERDEPDR